MSVSYSPHKPTVTCDHRDCKAFATQANAAALGWDWFTGLLPETRHFCAKHARSDQRNEEFAKSRNEVQK